MLTTLMHEEPASRQTLRRAYHSRLEILRYDGSDMARQQLTPCPRMAVQIASASLRVHASLSSQALAAGELPTTRVRLSVLGAATTFGEAKVGNTGPNARTIADVPDYFVALVRRPRRWGHGRVTSRVEKSHRVPSPSSVRLASNCPGRRLLLLLGVWSDSVFTSVWFLRPAPFPHLQLSNYCCPSSVYSIIFVHVSRFLLQRLHTCCRFYRHICYQHARLSYFSLGLQYLSTNLPSSSWDLATCAPDSAKQ